MAGNSTNIGKLVVDLLLKDDQFMQAMDGATKKTGTALPKMQQVANGALNAITKAFKVAAVAATGLAAATTVVGARFEQQMSAVAAVRGITDKTSDSYKALEGKARELGATTAFSATQAAQGMEALARAGLSTNEIIQSSETALKMAGAGGIELGRSAEIIAASMAQFGLAADDASTISDVFTAATQNSLFATEDLAQAMKFAGPVGAAFGKDIVEVTAAVAQFRDLGMEGTMAGTQFRMAMAAAAKPTSQAEAALKKYGLTAADINPELKSFKEIMLAVGDAGISTSDALAIFGTRAGGAVATIAKQMAQSSDKFDDLTSNLENSAGTTAKTYETMMDNVMGSMATLRSVTEELFLTLFDQFSGPLKDLMDSMTEVVGAVVEAVAKQGPALSQKFRETFGSISTFLQNNAAALAEAFVNTLQVAADLTPVLATVAQVLIVIARNADTLGVAMAAVLAVGTAIKFAAAINSLALAFGSAGTAVTVFGATLTVTTGGLFALVAAVGAAVVGIAALISKLMSAKSHTDKLREAQEKLEGRTAELAAAEEQRLGKVLDAQQARLRKRLSTDKELDDATRRRMEAVLNLSAAEARQAVADGKLIETGGELKNVQDLVARGGEDAADFVLQEAKALEASATATEKKTDKLEKLLKKGEDVNAVTYTRTEALADAERVLGREIATMEELRVITDDMIAKRQSEAQQAEALRNNVAKGTADAVKAEVAAELAGRDVIDQSRIDAAEQEQQRRAAAEQKIEALWLRLQQAASKSANDEVQARLDALARTEMEIEQSFAERLAMEKEGSDAALEIAARQTEAMKLARQTAENDITEINRKEAEKQADEAQRLAAKIVGFTREAVSEVQQLERDKQDALTELAEDGADERQQAEVAAAFDARVNEVRSQAESRANDLLLALRGKGLSQREQLEREKAQALIDLSDASAETRAEVEGEYDKLIKKAGFGVFDAFKLAGKAALAFGKAATGAAMGAMGAISGLLNKLSGFQFSLTDVIGGALDAQNEALDAQAEQAERVAEAQAALKEAQATGGDVGAAQAELADAQAALQESEAALGAGMPGFAADFVQTLVEDAAQFAMALAEGAGPALETLAAQMPILLDAVIAAIPEVIQAIIDNVPGIIMGIVSALPELITALVQGLTQVVLTIFQQLPALLTVLLTEVLPTLISEVAAALPVILQGLIDALPGIIQAIVSAIPIIIKAVVDALPDILTAVVGMLPEVIGLLIGAIPMIAVALVEGILFELVPAIPGIVAQLFKELFKGMGNMFKSIAEGIWEAIKDFFNIFKRKDGGKGNKGAFSGMSYVPATMRMTVHKGEAIVPADRNAESVSGSQGPAPAGAAQNGMSSGAGGGGAPIDIAIMAEGRLLDAVQVQAMKRGGAVGIQNEIRRSSGVRVGLDRGRFNPWSK